MFEGPRRYGRSESASTSCRTARASSSSSARGAAGARRGRDPRDVRRHRFGPVHLPRAARAPRRYPWPHGRSTGPPAPGAAGCVAERLGRSAWRWVKVRRLNARRKSVTFASRTAEREGDAAVGCDGITPRSEEFFPGERAFIQGINMWRGVTPLQAVSHRREHVIGGLEIGKLVVTRTRRRRRRQQLVNCGGDQSPRNVMQDWSLPGKLEDFCRPSRAGASTGRSAGHAARREAVYEYRWWIASRSPRGRAGRHAARRRGAPEYHASRTAPAGDSRCTGLAFLSGNIRSTGSIEELRSNTPRPVTKSSSPTGPTDRTASCARPRAHRGPAVRAHRGRDVQRGDPCISENYKRIAGFERDSLAARAPLA